MQVWLTWIAANWAKHVAQTPSWVEPWSFAAALWRWFGRAERMPFMQNLFMKFDQGRKPINFTLPSCLSRHTYWRYRQTGFSVGSYWAIVTVKRTNTHTHTHATRRLCNFVDRFDASMTKRLLKNFFRGIKTFQHSLDCFSYTDCTMLLASVMLFFFAS